MLLRACSALLVAIGVAVLPLACVDNQPTRIASHGPARQSVTSTSTSAALRSSLSPGATYGFASLSPGMDRANGINDAGLVVGDYGGNNVATTWTPIGGYHEVRRLDGSTDCCSTLTDVNATGQASGWSFSDRPISAVIWTQLSNSEEDLLVPERAYASSINDLGDVVGYHFDTGGPFSAFFKAHGEAPVSLLTVAGAVNAYAFGINNAGVIIGLNQLGDAGNPVHAIVWSHWDAAPTDLGTLGGFNSGASGINQEGDVVGYSEIAGGARHAMLWTVESGMVDLSSWPNGCVGTSEAMTVNDVGVIGGTCKGAPVLWTATEGMRSLPLPNGVSLGEPHAINNANQVVGIFNGFGGAIWTVTNPNVAPVATGLFLPSLPVLVGATVSVTATFTDANGSDSHTASFDWGDGQTSLATVTADGGNGSLSGSHRYQSAGEYIVSVTVTDNGGLSAVLSSAAAATKVQVNPPPGATIAGSNIAVTPVDQATGATPVTLTFSSVTAPGTTTVTSSGMGAPPPSAFKMGNPPVYYELQSTATFAGAVSVCFSYTPSAFHNAGNLRLFHGGSSGGWTDVTTSNDATEGKICGSVTSFSPFMFAELSYDFTGFFQPVDNPGSTGVMNTLKAGSAVPVKFTLGGNLGLGVLASTSPTSSAYTCTGSTEDAVEVTVTAGASAFSYDATAGQYVYVWKTDKTWGGTCRKLTVVLKDGTTHQALFKFSK
jgi:probable HAF family extracellular repeat protein